MNKYEEKIIRIMLDKVVIEMERAQRIPYHRRIIMSKYHKLVQRADKLATLLIS